MVYSARKGFGDGSIQMVEWMNFFIYDGVCGLLTLHHLMPLLVVKRAA